MEFVARFYDGLVASATAVICRIDGSREAGSLVITDLATRRVITSWNAAEVFPLHGRRNELKIGALGQPNGARLTVLGFSEVQRARDFLPALRNHQRLDTARQWRIAGLTTGALVMVILAYIYGVPLLASRLVWMVPSDWETRMGDTVAEQMEAALAEESGFKICDPNPDSLANAAIRRFADAAIDGSGSPFDLNVTVVKTDVPNAFALPGGRVYYFSALLDSTESPDEFAGVLAHEIGHVVHRHGMEQLISTAGTGLLVGFILGDMTGMSVAAGLGATLVDSRFSREAESQADAYSASVAKRLAFQPAGLPDLLDRVAGDDDFSTALALLSTHPLSSERRAALAKLMADADPNLEPAFTDAEWRAIKAMCGPPAKKQDKADPKPGPETRIPETRADDKN